MPLETPIETERGKTEPSSLSLFRLFRIWFSFGVQSFGGGSTTLALIQRAAIDRESWMTVEEFTHYWAVSQVAPGINLFCLTILIGRHIAGFAGMVVCMLGLIIPSVSVTILMTAGYAYLQHFPVLQRAVRGIIPATVGLGLVTTVRMLYPLLKRGYHEGVRSFSALLLLLFGSIVIAAQGRAVIYLVLVSMGLFGGLLYGTVVVIPKEVKGEESL